MSASLSEFLFHFGVLRNDDDEKHGKFYKDKSKWKKGFSLERKKFTRWWWWSFCCCSSHLLLYITLTNAVVIFLRCVKNVSWAQKTLFFFAVAVRKLYSPLCVCVCVSRCWTFYSSSSVWVFEIVCMSVRCLKTTIAFDVSMCRRNWKIFV